MTATMTRPIVLENPTYDDLLTLLRDDDPRPWMLDLFCCAGGATRGYQLAGFRVLGVDNQDRPEYCGDAFVKADAIMFALLFAHMFVFIHASPPCQFHSALTKGNKRRRQGQKINSAFSHVDLIPATRDVLLASGRPFVIENVQGSTVRRDLILCGLMFGLQVFRDRYFEIHGFAVPQPHHQTHRTSGHRVAGWRHGVRYEGDMFAVYGDGGGKGSLTDWQGAMGIDWVTDKPTLAEAIPPAYTAHIGRHVLAALAVA